MIYARPPFPVALFQKFCRVARLLGYVVRGHRWQLLDLMLDHAEAHPDLFRKR